MSELIVNRILIVSIVINNICSIHLTQDDYLNHLQYIIKRQLSFGILQEFELLKRKFQRIKSIKIDQERAGEETLEEVNWHGRVLEKGFRTTPPRVIGRYNAGISHNVRWIDNQEYFIDAAIAQLNSEDVHSLRNSDAAEMIGTKKCPRGRCSSRDAAFGDLCKSGRTTEYTDLGRHARPSMYLRDA